MHVAVIDTETTGMTEDDEAIEIGVVNYHTGEYKHSLLGHHKPISFGAMAAHHITPDMTAGLPNLEEWLAADDHESLDEHTVLAAHNAAFDRQYLPNSNEWICTYRCALALLPDAESHSNMSLRYELGLDISDMPRVAGDLPHRALYDAWVTRALLRHLVGAVRAGLDCPTEGECLEYLINVTKNPILLKKVSFGKHVGELWSDVPFSYLTWIVGQNFDGDVLHTAQYHINEKRRK